MVVLSPPSLSIHIFMDSTILMKLFDYLRMSPKTLLTIHNLMFFAGTDFECIRAELKVRPRLKMWNKKAKHCTFVGAGAWLSGRPEGLLATPST